MSKPTQLYLTVIGVTRFGGIWSAKTIEDAIHKYCPECTILDIPSGYSVRNRATHMVESRPVLVEFPSITASKPYRHGAIFCKDYELDG